VWARTESVRDKLGRYQAHPARVFENEWSGSRLDHAVAHEKTVARHARWGIR